MPKPALKFQLVHRDDRDPLALDDGSSQYVLQPINTDQRRRRAVKDVTDASDFQDDSLSQYCTSEAGHILQASKVDLPLSVLPSEFEERSGILARNELITGAIRNAPEDVSEKFQLLL